MSWQTSARYEVLNTMMESKTFAVLLNENTSALDAKFEAMEAAKKLEFAARPDAKKFRPGRVLVIAQDGHNDVFAAVGSLEDATLEEDVLSFREARRFTIPVVLASGDDRSALMEGKKGGAGDFMYLAPEAAERVAQEAERLRRAVV